jgi:hypothetical protein
MYGSEYINRNESYYHYQTITMKELSLSNHYQRKFYLYNQKTGEEINTNKYLLFCTVNKLELVRSLVAFLNTLIIPQSLHMVIIFLQLKNNNIVNQNSKKQLNMIKTFLCN